LKYLPKRFYNTNNDFPGKSVSIAPIFGAALAAKTNPVGTLIGEIWPHAKIEG